MYHVLCTIFWLHHQIVLGKWKIVHDKVFHFSLTKCNYTMFTSDKPIYLQMADRMKEEILSGTYSDDMRIPSVREYGILLQVNTNTAVKCYEQLSRDGIIYQRRGMGYFVTAGARDRIMQQRKDEFFQTTCPQLKKDLELLGITIEEFIEHIK